MNERSKGNARLVDVEDLLAELGKLDWSHGLTRERLLEELPEFPQEVYMLLPSEREFVAPREVAEYYRHAWVRRQSEGIPAAGAREDGGPAAWGPSPPAIGGRVVGGTHGVGSGTDSGFTGSTEMGIGRSGASYGPESDEEPEQPGE